MATAAMSAIGGLVRLLYRARWVRSSFSGEVVSRRVHHRFEDQERGTVFAASGGGYRARVVDSGGDVELAISEWEKGEIPFGELLAPSWLLARYDLEIAGVAEHIGRAVYVLKALPRYRGARQAGQLPDRVEALVDADLGILLRYEKTGPGGRTETAEFTSLSVDDAEPTSAGQEPGRWQASPEFTDQQVNLLYRPALAPLRFSGELREWSDQETMRRLGETALASTDLGKRMRWLWQSAEDGAPENIDLTAQLAVAMPGAYRPAAPLPPGTQGIIDLAWLLDARLLSPVASVTVDGRPALRVLAAASAVFEHGPLSDALVTADEVEVSIDLELGIAVRQVWYLEGSPVLSTELSKISLEVDPA